MSVNTQTLTEFLLARIAEDEATDMGLPHRDACRQFGGWPDDPASAMDCTCGLTARVLAECEAKRRIVEVARFGPEGAAGWGFRKILRHLAAVYADHPDYRDEWRP